MTTVMTKQEIFDTVLNGLRNQKIPSYKRRDTGDVECLYRGPEGRKCAAGMLIPDDQYRPDMEGQPFVWLVNGTYKHFADVPDHLVEHRNFITSLQQLHDRWAEGAYGYYSWEGQMKSLATSNGLQYNPAVS